MGGPLREIALFSGACVTGINNNEYQVSKATAYNCKVGLGRGAVVELWVVGALLRGRGHAQGKARAGAEVQGQ